MAASDFPKSQWPGATESTGQSEIVDSNRIWNWRTFEHILRLDFQSSKLDRSVAPLYVPVGVACLMNGIH
jgi:hypothetical protein